MFFRRGVTAAAAIGEPPIALGRAEAAARSRLPPAARGARYRPPRFAGALERRSTCACAESIRGATTRSTGWQVGACTSSARHRGMWAGRAQDRPVVAADDHRAGDERRGGHTHTVAQRVVRDISIRAPFPAARRRRRGVDYDRNGVVSTELRHIQPLGARANSDSAHRTIRNSRPHPTTRNGSKEHWRSLPNGSGRSPTRLWSRFEELPPSMCRRHAAAICAAARSSLDHPHYREVAPSPRSAAEQKTFEERVAQLDEQLARLGG